MFVVSTDFDRLPFNLTGLDRLVDEFADFVSYNEEEYLRKLLGNKFYDAFVAGLAALPPAWEQTETPDGYDINDLVVYGGDIFKSLSADNVALPTDAVNWEVQPANRWLRLREGDTYTYYGRPQKWYGMKRLVVPLIYSLWTKYTFDNQTAQGVVVSRNENSETISIGVRVARAWNKYALLCAGRWPNVINWQWVFWPELENSLFGYLFLTAATFDDLFTDGDGYGSMQAYLMFEFRYPGFTNSFGI